MDVIPGLEVASLLILIFLSRVQYQYIHTDIPPSSIAPPNPIKPGCIMSFRLPIALVSLLAMLIPLALGFWPTDRGDFGLTHATADAGPATFGSIRWNVSVVLPSYAAPATILVGDGSLVYVADGSWLRALDRVSGLNEWERLLSNTTTFIALTTTGFVYVVASSTGYGQEHLLLNASTGAVFRNTSGYYGTDTRFGNIAFGEGAHPIPYLWEMCTIDLTQGRYVNCGLSSLAPVGFRSSAFDGTSRFFFECSSTTGSYTSSSTEPTGSGYVCAYNVSSNEVTSPFVPPSDNLMSADFSTTTLFAATPEGPIFYSAASATCEGNLYTPWWELAFGGDFCLQSFDHFAASPGGNTFALGLTLSDNSTGFFFSGIWVISRTTKESVWNISMNYDNFVMDGNDNLYASDSSKLVAFSPSGLSLWSLSGNFSGLSLGDGTTYAYQHLVDGSVCAVAIDGTVVSPSPSPSPSTPSSSSSVLSVGALVGICTGCVVFGACVTALICHRCNKAPRVVKGKSTFLSLQSHKSLDETKAGTWHAESTLQNSLLAESDVATNQEIGGWGVQKGK